MNLAGHRISSTFWIVDSLSLDCILGFPDIASHGIVIDPKRATVSIGTSSIEILASPMVRASERTVVPPNSSLLVAAYIDAPCAPNSPGTISPLSHAHAHSGSSHLPLAHPQSFLVPSLVNAVFVSNPNRSRPLIIPAHRTLGVIEQHPLIPNSRQADSFAIVEDSDMDVPLSSDPKNPSPSSSTDDNLTSFSINPNLTPDQRSSLKALLREFTSGPSPVLTNVLSVCGAAKVTPHRLELSTDHPVAMPRRRVPQLKRKVISEMIDQMLADGVISPCASPFAAPVHLVRKPDGNWRFCVDYVGLNAVTKPDLHPIPLIEDLVTCFAGCQFITVIDLVSGFWQIAMDPRDREKVAFRCDRGQFTWNCMPFGLRNAPSTFQRAMQQTLSGMEEFATAYFDDIQVRSSSFADHLRHVRLVLQRLADHGFQAKIAKCKFAMTEVKYLGRIVSGSGSRPDPEMVAAVARCSSPKNLEELRSFLGKVNYYREFIKDLSTHFEPLYRLLDKSATFTWTPACEEAFEFAKATLTSFPVLAMPVFNDPSRPFVLYTDASNYGISAVLSQAPPDKPFTALLTLPPIAYWSKALNKSERKYTVTERECLAIVRGVAAFAHYLDAHFLVVTDHSALIHLLPSHKSPDHIYRWSRQLAGYSFQVFHKAGKLHANADSLSRAPFVSVVDGEVIPDSATLACLALSDLSLKQKTQPVNWKSEQASDPFCTSVLNALKPNASISNSLRPFIKFVKLIDGVIHHHPPKFPHPRVVVPEHLRANIVEAYHCSPITGAHLGPSKIAAKLQERFYWPSLFNDVSAFCDSCETCSSTKHSNALRIGYLHPIIPKFPWHIIGIDVVVELPPSRSGRTQALVVVDYFSKWLEVFPIDKASSTAIRDVILDHIICRHGCPQIVISDHAANLNSSALIELFDHFGIEKRRSTAHHQQTDGACERVIGTLKQMLRAFVCARPDYWEDYLPLLVSAYNNNAHSTTGYPPYEILYGRKSRNPHDAAFGFQPHSINALDADDFRKKLSEYAIRLHEAQLLTQVVVSANIEKAAERNLKQYNKHRRPQDVIKVDSFAWINASHGTPPTGLDAIRTGPYRVVSLDNLGVAVLAHPAKSDQRYRINVQHLTPAAKGPDDPASVPDLPRPLNPRPITEVDHAAARRAADEFWYSFKDLLRQIHTELSVAGTQDEHDLWRRNLSLAFDSVMLLMPPQVRANFQSQILHLPRGRLEDQLQHWITHYDKEILPFKSA